MKESLIKILASIPLLGINWAALHDISVGEPNPYMEYSVVIASGLLAIYLLVNRYIKLKQDRI